MSEFQPENSEKRTEREVVYMSAVAEASNLLRAMAEPRLASDSVKLAIGRAARRVSKYLPSPMGYSRAEGIWRQEARSIRAEEMDALRKAADARLIEGAKNEFAELRARIARIETALRLSDSDFHGPSVDALRGSMGEADRTLD